MRTIKDFIKYRVVVAVRRDYERDMFLDFCREHGLKVELNPRFCGRGYYFVREDDETTVIDVQHIPCGCDVILASEFIG